MKKLTTLALALVLTAACGGSTETKPAEAPPTTPPAETPAAPAPVEPAPAAAAAPASEVLLDPSKATETAPEKFTVRLETSKGPVLIDVDRAMAPQGADRFFNLVKAGFYTDTAFFRVVQGFVVQVGISGDPKVAATWREASIQDDPVKGTNARGTVTFATAGPNTRTTQIFINLGDNANLDQMGFAPFGKVRDMGPIDALNTEYGERPNQGALQAQGNAYLREKFPNLDYIKAASIEP